MSDTKSLDDELHLIIKAARIKKDEDEIFDSKSIYQGDDPQLSPQTLGPQFAQQGGGSEFSHQSRLRQQVVQLLKLPLLLQLCRFGIVGVFAAAIHFMIVVTLVQSYALEPLVANIFAFMVSFQASYFGHRRFTFGGTETLHATAFPKLLTLQIFNFIANESLFFFFLSLHIPYQVALILVLSILPLFTFAVSKVWIFQK